jgi:aspartyl/glutamyl-tRNA(Asn/Gln) amidotransferase C subunit
MQNIAVQKIAELARITLTENDAATFESQVLEIIEFNADRLSKISDLPKKVEAVRISINSLSHLDEPKPSLSQELALANAAESLNGFIVVPKVLE